MRDNKKERIMLGAICGDIIGSVYEVICKFLSVSESFKNVIFLISALWSLVTIISVVVVISPSFLMYLILSDAKTT